MFRWIKSTSSARITKSKFRLWLNVLWPLLILAIVLVVLSLAHRSYLPTLVESTELALPLGEHTSSNSSHLAQSQRLSTSIAKPAQTAQVDSTLFSGLPDQALRSAFDLALGDLDNDGDLDIVLAYEEGPASIYLNENSRLIFNRTITQAGCAIKSSAVRLGDVDKDLRIDIAFSCSHKALILKNLGLNDDGIIELSVSPWRPVQLADRISELADVNGDGYLDIATAYLDEIAIYLNDQGGTLREEPAFTRKVCGETIPQLTACANIWALTWGDMDKDGWLDLAIASDGSEDLVFQLDGESVDSDNNTLLMSPAVILNADLAKSLDADWGDYDSDGRLDLAVGTAGGEIYFYRNLGTSLATQPSLAIRPVVGDARGLDFGDADNDGDLDLAIAIYRGPNIILFNQSGTFYESSISKTENASSAGAGVEWGDLNNDGSLDITFSAGSGSAEIYYNTGANIITNSSINFSLTSEQHTYSSVALGDADGDGDLDLAVGAGKPCAQYGEPVSVYLNNNGQLAAEPAWTTGDTQQAFDVAWADIDLDGDLDLSIANGWYRSYDGCIRNVESRNQIFRNDGIDANGQLVLVKTSEWTFPEEDSYDLDWGDIDGDGDLDFVVANGGAEGILEPKPAEKRQNRIYLNMEGPEGTRQFVPSWESSFAVSGILEGKPIKLVGDSTNTVALGDMDGDGDLDLAEGNSPDDNCPERCGFNRAYRNDGIDESGQMRMTLVWESTEQDSTQDLEWGDVDGDGDLDLLTSNQGGPTLIYFNHAGQLERTASWRSVNIGSSRDISALDIDGDLDLDIIEADESAGIRVYRNDSGVIRRNAVTLYNSATKWFTWGDVTGDGVLDVVSAEEQDVRLIVGQRPANPLHPKLPSQSQGTIESIRIDRRSSEMVGNSLSLASTEGYAMPGIRADGTIPISFTLFHPSSQPMRNLTALYSPDGGGTWRTAKLMSDTITSETELATAPYPSVTVSNGHVVEWDVFGSGFFGQSDNVIVRLQASPNQRIEPNSVAGPFQRLSVNAQTYPFRVRGTQVRVVTREPITGTQMLTVPRPVANAVVLRLPIRNDSSYGMGMAIGTADNAFRTNIEGYLEGGGQINIGDRLVALWPQWDESGIAFFFTNADATIPIDQYGHEVAEQGVQVLEVATENPLYLFDLTVSLEWDARNDGNFLDDLAGAITKSSEVLYDVTNGQMALGNVSILQDREGWLDSDLTIYTNNRMRPRATMGGLVNTPRSEVLTTAESITVVSGITRTRVITKVLANAYTPGQIRMGPSWDPFGQNRADLTQDWHRALAHEYGHYFLFLTDNYLGYSKHGAIISIDCQGSFMTSASNRAYSQFLARVSDNELANEGVRFWDIPDSTAGNDCLNTVAQRLTTRSDWETITHFYPAINDTRYLTRTTNARLNLTQIQIFDPLRSTSDPLSATNFDLRSAESGERLVLQKGQAYLFKPLDSENNLDGDTMIALGSAVKTDRIMVRGADAGDNVLMIDSSSDPAIIGWSNNVESTNLLLHEVEGWNPDIVVEHTTLAKGPGIITYTVSFTESKRGDVVPIVETKLVTLVKPALKVTVDLPGVDETITHVSAQVLSLYGSPVPHWPELSPTVTLTKATEAESTLFAGTIELDYPLYAGYVRVWAGTELDDPLRHQTDGLQMAITDFYINSDCSAVSSGAWCQNSYFDGYIEQNPMMGIDLTKIGSMHSGGGANFRSGGGANFRSGGGANFRSGGGANFRSGGGANFRSGGGANFRSGGGANFRSGGGANFRSGGGANFRSGGGADLRGWGANQYTFGAPIASSDGNVTIFNNFDVLGDTGVETLQALSSFSSLPSHLTLVGQGYRVGVTSRISRTIAFNYLQRDVPDGYEYTLKLYYGSPDGSHWEPLETDLNLDDNLAIAAVAESGFYALAASVDIPIVASGWNLLAYPLPMSQPVAEALQSISGTYSIVFGFDSEDTSDPWKVYDASAETPMWVNDLFELSFGNGYWVLTSRPTLLQLAVPQTIGQIDNIRLAGSSESVGTLRWRTPPAIFYGQITGPENEVLPDREIVALVDGTQCGGGRIRNDGRLFVVKVWAAELGIRSQCGLPGAPVTFQIGEPTSRQTLQTSKDALWTNDHPTQLDLVLR